MWPRKKEPPAPAPVQPAPGGASLGVNLPANSPAAQLRAVGRMIRLHDAMAKASKRQDRERINALDDELQVLRAQLLGVGVRAPYKRDELVTMHDEITARLRAGGR